MELEQNQEGNKLFKIDKKIFFITLRRKSIFIIATAFIVAIIGGIYAKFTIDHIWKAQCVLIRHKKNLSANTDVPYLYQEMDYNTILQSIKMRNNLQIVIDSLKLKTTPPKFYGTIEVNRGSRSNLINIRAKHEDRQTAVNIANLLGEVFIDSYINIINSSTQKIYNYYLEQKKVYDDKINKIEDELAEFRDQHKILSLEKEMQNKYDNLKILELDLINTRMNVSTLKTKIDDIKELIDKLPEKIELTSTVSATRKKQLKILKSDLALLRKKYTDKNPKIIKLQDEIKSLEKTINSESEEDVVPDRTTYGKNSLRESMILEKTQYENDLHASQEKIKEYEQKISSIKSQLKSLSPIEREYYDIQNEKKTTKSQLSRIKNRMSESKIAMESNLSDFEILELAVPPKYPEASGKKMIVLIFGFVTFLGLTVYFLASEFFDFSVKSKFDFKEVLQIKMLGEVPNKDSVPPPIFYSQTQILYGQLNSYLPKEKAVVAVGKDRAETGASFIIQELVELLLTQDKKILWIESLKEKFADTEEYIINEYVYNNRNIAEPQKYKITDQLHKSYFICNDQTFKKIFDQEQIEKFIAEQKEYDLIFWELFDVNYNLQLFNTISSASDLLMFVARFRHSDKKQLATAVEFLKENNKIPILGILNDSRKPYFSITY